MVFTVVMYGYECWTIKKAECQRTDAFELWCWRRLLRVPWTASRSNQSILKEISPGCSLEGLMLKLKLQYFGHLLWRADSFEKSWYWKRLRAGGEGDDRMRWMVGWHHHLNRHELEQALGVSDGQGSLVCCRSWGRKVLDMIEGLNWTKDTKIGASMVAQMVSGCPFRRPRFDPWVRKTSWRRKYQPTPVFLPAESHGWRSLAGYSSWGHKESDMTEQLTLSRH